ncbi:MAG: hypothetical protein ACK4GN_18575, partial [Runella sp.]
REHLARAYYQQASSPKINRYEKAIILTMARAFGSCLLSAGFQPKMTDDSASIWLVLTINRLPAPK